MNIITIFIKCFSLNLNNGRYKNLWFFLSILIISMVLFQNLLYTKNYSYFINLLNNKLLSHNLVYNLK